MQGGGDQVNNISLEDLMCVVGAGEGGLLANRDIFMYRLGPGVLLLPPLIRLCP